MNEEEVADLIHNLDNISEPFKVYVRIRPFLQKEYQKLRRNNSITVMTNPSVFKNDICKSIFAVNNKTLYVFSPKNNNIQEKKYAFNKIFTEKDNNNDVFECAIKPTINNVINGYNSTTLAYGVTGTGKTHTIFGDLALDNGEDGVAIKACEYLFQKLNKEYFDNDYEIKVSYIEIYNENVIDLLNNENENMSLMIIEDPNKGVYVHNVKEFIINSSYDLKKLISQGNKKRTMAPTNQNKFSSRSHAILQLSLKRKQYNEKKNNFDIFFSKFLIVDLAGSERGGLEKGKRREEGANINKSLFTLGSCINILSDKTKSGKFIPYRDSKLTRLLKDSLGGNILTVMLVCLSPSSESYEESISSLNYANRAKKIQKKIFQNKKEVDFIEGNNNFSKNNSGNVNQYEEIIDSLKNEIYQLKNIIKEQETKLRNKNSNLNNNTLYLDEDSFLKKDGEEISDKVKKFFNDESSILSNVQVAKSQKINKNNKNEEIDISLVENINKINLDKYEIFFKSIKNKDKDIEIDELQKLIENIKYDKNVLEVYLEQNNIPLNIIDNENNTFNNNEKKYIEIKKYYDKFLEVINDKLIENIEQNMILKCNNKEITELNKNNIETFNTLQKQLQNYKQNIEHKENDNICKNLTEQIKNIENTIKENLRLKNGVLKTYKENMEKKKQLKLILLNLLGDKRENSNKLINILKDKEKLVEKNKQFQKIIEKYTQIQKEKDNNINLIQRQVEILRSKLKEKEKKIFELKKQNYNIINNSGKKNYTRNKSNNNMKENNFLYVKKMTNNNSINKIEINNYINKGKRNISCVRNNDLFCNKNKNTKNKKRNKKLSTYTYCYNESNEELFDSNNNFNQLSKITSQINTKNIKKRNNPKNRCKSEEMRKENNKMSCTNESNNNNTLFKKIMLKKTKENNEVYDLRNNQDNHKDLTNYINSPKDSKDKSRNIQEVLSKYKILDNSTNSSNNNIKIILDTKINKHMNNWNLTQKRYEKFLNINPNMNNNNNNIKTNISSNSRKIHIRNNSKKHSLNEARYEKKIKNEMNNEKRKDLSVELNHINAEKFINGFKGISLKQIEMIENAINKNNMIITQDTQNTNTTNNYMERNNKGINTQNLTINMENNCQIETKDNDSTNFKTDQSKILKTDDIYQDLVNSLKNAPFKFKHK